VDAGFKTPRITHQAELLSSSPSNILLNFEIGTNFFWIFLLIGFQNLGGFKH